MTTAEIALPFNECFAEANRSRARYRLLCGGAGSGKSRNTAQDLLLKLSDVTYRGANLLVVRKTESSCRDSTFAELIGAAERVFGADADRYWDVRQEPMGMTSRITGASILFRGMKDAAQRERVKSIAFPTGKLTWIWIEEATELEAADLDLLDDRLRGDLTALNPELYYQITMTFNPVSARHWLKRRFWDAPPSPDVFLHHSTYRDNHFLDAGYAARMERRAREDPDGYAVYGRGEWGAGKSGLILTHWRVADVSTDRGDYDAVWLAQDFGYNHADCILLVGMRDGVLYVLRELYERGRDTAELIAQAERMGLPKDVPMWCDSAEPDRIRMWKKAGFLARGVVKEPGSIAAQIDVLKQHPLVIGASCGNVIAELEEWRWEDADGGVEDVPHPGHDDAMAALRYAAEPLRRGQSPGGGLSAGLSKRAMGL